MLVLFVLGVLFLVEEVISIGNAPIDYEPRIVNGIPISASKYPWIVSLQAKERFGDDNITERFCGGSLINVYPPIILTAAHCITFNMTNGTLENGGYPVLEFLAVCFA